MESPHFEPKPPTSGHKREAKREALPDLPGAGQRLKVLTAAAPTVFRRGFSLTCDKRKLYVRTAGTKVPLGLDWQSASDEEVLSQALRLREHLQRHQGAYNREAWLSQLPSAASAHGEPQGRAGSLEELGQFWWERKEAEGISRATFEKHYGRHIRKLNPRTPLSEESLLQVIRQSAADSATRKRLVGFLRDLVKARGGDWNATLLDPLQMQGKQVRHREQPFFSDAEIETIVSNTTNASWRRVFALMAVYGLRPWEAWIAEPSRQYAKCARITIGKKNSKGQNPPRDVPPFHPHWYEHFQIERLWSTPLPTLNKLSQAGHRSTKQLQRYGFCQEQSQASTRKAAYGFRHAYARRIHTEAYRVTDTHGALFMGHTTDNHNKQYRRWIDGQEDPFRAYQPRA